MDEWLARVYGTSGAEDLEKVAQAEMLSQMAEQEGVDLSGLSPEQLEALAQEVLQQGGEEAVQAQGEGSEQASEEELAAQQASEEDLAKEASAKFEEADFLGRVMAHAYTQELTKIAASQGTVGRFLGKVKNIATAKGARQAHAAMKSETARGEAYKRLGQNSMINPKHHKRLGETAGKHFGNAAEQRTIRNREAGKTVGLYAGGAAAAGLGAKAFSGKKEKTASAFEQLAEQRALEMLQESGIEQTEKTADPMEMFNEALNRRAQEMLTEAGYSFDDSETAEEPSQE